MARKRFYTTRTSSRHNPSANDAASISNSDETMDHRGDTAGSESDMTTARARAESEDHLSAPVAANSSMAPKHSKEASGSSRSKKRSHGQISTLTGFVTGADRDANDADSEHDAKRGDHGVDEEGTRREIDQLNSQLEAKIEEIRTLKEGAEEAYGIYLKELDQRFSVEQKLEEMTSKYVEVKDFYESLEGEFAEEESENKWMRHELESMSKELDKTRSQMDGQRIEIVELTKALNEKETKLANLQQAMARLGRNKDQPIDAEIAQKFSSLKSDIIQYVRLLFSLGEDDGTPDDAADSAGEDQDGEGDEGDGGSEDSELQELQFRHGVAEELYQRFFGVDILSGVLGASAACGGGLEQQLRDGECSESLIKARRTAHFKACTATKGFGKALDKFAENQCKAHWLPLREGTGWISQAHVSEVVVVERAIRTLFRDAARLAIYLQGLRVEYEWEQVTRAQGSEVNKKYDDIIGTCGPAPAMDSKLGFVVFGGVVRGDKTSGLLADARVRLLKNQIVIA
ncbi:hypothetical protein QBC39DRAFT_408467 [Podospora conica]|nr:hypothetical protein QBC39DRAFT_408467 [Schizothecium conicum]